MIWLQCISLFFLFTLPAKGANTECCLPLRETQSTASYIYQRQFISHTKLKYLRFGENQVSLCYNLNLAIWIMPSPSYCCDVAWCLTWIMFSNKLPQRFFWALTGFLKTCIRTAMATTRVLTFFFLPSTAIHLLHSAVKVGPGPQFVLRWQ